SAEIKSLDRHAIIAVAQNRPRRKELTEPKLAMKDIAVDEAEPLFEVERRKRLTRQHGGFEIRRVARNRVDDQVCEGLLLAGIGPASPVRKLWRDVLHEKAGDVLAGWRQTRIERRRNHHLDNGLARPTEGAGVEIGTFEIIHRRTDHDAGAMVQAWFLTGPAEEIGKFGERDVHPKRT